MKCMQSTHIVLGTSNICYICLQTLDQLCKLALSATFHTAYALCGHDIHDSTNSSTLHCWRCTSTNDVDVSDVTGPANVKSTPTLSQAHAGTDASVLMHVQHVSICVLAATNWVQLMQIYNTTLKHVRSQMGKI